MEWPARPPLVGGGGVSVVKPLACADLSRLIRRLYYKDKLEQGKGEETTTSRIVVRA